MKSIKINQDKILTKNINKFSKNIAETSILNNNIFKYLLILFFLLFIIYQTKIIKDLKTINKNISENRIDKNIELNFEYHLYEREMISEKMIKYSGWFLEKNEPYFINGIIRKYKPKKCLEIGVGKGGSSIIILNALKDINDSFLVSLDLNSFNRHNNYHIGENVKTYFPELTNNNKWQLFTGKQPHKFLDKLKLKYDFLFLDTAHIAPGELFNIIEAMPFLEKNAIIILHDIMLHLPTINNYYKPREVKFHPSQIFLMTSLPGYKVIIEDENKGAENIGAVFLNSNNENDYLNYFLLLLSPWEYMPSNTHIKQLRAFISKYYKKKIFLHLFDRAVEENNIYINDFKNVYKNVFGKRN